MSELVRNKDLKNRVRFSTSLDKDLAKRLDDLSITTRIPKSKLVDEAIEMLLDKHENKLKFSYKEQKEYEQYSM